MKRYKFPTLMLLCLVLLTMMAMGADAHTNGKNASQASAVASPGKAVSTSAAMHVVNMANVPKETSAQAAANSQRRSLPQMAGVSSQVYAQRKAAAAHSQLTVKSGADLKAPVKSSSSGMQTPNPISTFQGMSDSTSICAPFGCEPPDQALAASFSQVVQGVNTSFAVYNLKGVLQPGWPKSAQTFFGIPNPGSCDPFGPFLSDPRAFYDQNFNRFWVAILQIQGQLIDSCPDTTAYWIAVSQTGNANGAWNVYRFDMSFGTDNAADFTELGFDQEAIYFSGNMFSQSAGTFQYAEYLASRKIAMMNGQAVTARGFLDPTLNATPLDTIQPTLGEGLQAGGPLGGQFIASENIDFGGGQCSASTCSGVVVFSISNPGNSTQSASAVFVSTDGYSFPPGADEPGCAGCIDTGDTRISGTPVWHNGVITFSLNTAVNNGTQIVPGIFWGQISVFLNNNGSIQSATVAQEGYFDFIDDDAAMYGAMGSDSDGDVFMVYSFSGGSINPSLAFTTRRVTFTPGGFPDSGVTLQSGLAPYLGSRWGDYNALSPSGVPFTDEVWFSGEYSNANGDWSTVISHSKLTACFYFTNPCAS